MIVLTMVVFMLPTTLFAAPTDVISDFAIVGTVGEEITPTVISITTHSGSWPSGGIGSDYTESAKVRITNLPDGLIATKTALNADKSTLTFTVSGIPTVAFTGPATLQYLAPNPNCTFAIAEAPDKITLAINGGSSVSGATLEKAIEKSGLTADTITDLNITAGEVTAADWTYMNTLTSLARIEIADAIPNENVADIPDYCFSNTTLREILVPQSIAIGMSAFEDSTIEKAEFPRVTSIKDATFRQCTNLTTAQIPEATSIGDRAFFACANLAAANFPKAVTIGEESFSDCYLLTDVNFSGLETVNPNAFFGCITLETINLPKVQTIEAEAFTSCLLLATMHLPATPPTVADNAVFSDLPTPRSLVYVNAEGTLLTGEDLAAAVNNYKAVQGTDGTWYGWTISAQAELSQIAITTPPTKTTYTAGETFDKTGMVVTASYSDGTLTPVTDYTISPDRPLAIGDTQVTVTYTKDGTTKTADVAITVNAVNPPTPVITAGGGSTYQISAGNNITVTCSGKLEDLTGIYVDGTLVDAANYTLASGSTIVTVKASYLDTLSVGKHTLKFQYKDNLSAETDFTIIAKKAPKNDPVVNESKVPQTGDNSNGVLYTFLLLLSGCAVAAVTYQRKKINQ